MIERQIREYLLPYAFNAAVQAGAEIMKVSHQRRAHAVKVKSDNSPLTIADRRAHNKIKEVLGITRIPILSEEGRELNYEERKNWDMFWLVDPLDGTVEFLKGNNEFTVNIALMRDNECVGAIVYVPYLKKLYFAEQGCGAMLLEGVEPSEGASYTDQEIRQRAKLLPLDYCRHDKFCIAVSRSHQTAETASYIEEISRAHPNFEIIEQGSSYKFCLMAEGKVDYYPRTTVTYEWDTAAAELILVEAGGVVHSLPDHLPLRYNKRDLRNPWFECHRLR